jgi:hypothetical protein
VLSFGVVKGKFFGSLERNKYLPRNAAMTSWKCGISNNAVTIWCITFQLLVDSFCDMRIMPTPRAIGATTNDFSCTTMNAWQTMTF